MVEDELQRLKSVIDYQKSKANLFKPFNKFSPPKDLPAHLNIDGFIKSFSTEIFTQDAVLAHSSLGLTLFYLLSSVFVLTHTSWFVWPLAWVVAGAAATGLMAIGHDCGRNLFSESTRVNDIVGSLVMLPLGYPFESWKTYHHTNTAPIKVSNSLINGIWKLAYGPTFWCASIGYWAQHFEPLNYKTEDRQRVLTSNYFFLATFLAFLTAIYWCADFIGVVKLWLMPWLVFHVLLSTHTILPQVVFGPKSPALVHLVYPEWLECLTNALNIALPHRVASTIPHYRSRDAYHALKHQWGEYLLEIKVDWDLVVQLLDHPVQFEDFKPLSYPPLFNNQGHWEKRCINSIPPWKQWLNAIAWFWENINFLHAFWATFVPFCWALYGFVFVTPHMYTKVWTVICTMGLLVGISAGYHRLWSHRAYSARNPTKIILLLLGTAAMQRSVIWWARDHRAHHKYTDTDKDPYNTRRGFWHAQFGWLLFKSEPSESTLLPINMDDLYQDPLILWQYDNFVPLSIVVGVCLPSLVCCLWGDLLGGICYGFGLRVLAVHHMTHSINSLAHYWGDATYADEHTPRDNFFAALLTFGEGYHNFHHEFPSDYRNGVKFYHWDPNKWLIAGLSYIGQTYGLKITPSQLIKRSELQMKQKKVEAMRSNSDWIPTSSNLPTISRANFDLLVAEGFKFVIIRGKLPK